MNETELERLIVRLQGDATQYQRMVAQATASTVEVGKVMDAGAQKAQGFGRAVDGLGSRMSSFAGQMRALTALESPMGILTGGVSLAAQAQLLESNFRVMLGSAEKAKQLRLDIQAFAAQTPLNMGDLEQFSKMLLQAGIPLEQLLPTIQNLGDVALGNSEKIRGLAYAFGQVKTFGRLMGGELIQLRNAGFDPLAEISRTTGKGMGELRKEMEKGMITFEMVANAFKTATAEGGRFKGGMSDAAKETLGLFSTMQDDIDGAKRAIGEAAVESLHLNDAMKQVSAAAQEFTRWFTQLGPTVKTIATVMGALVLSLGAAAVAWKVGALAVGGIVGVYQHVRATIPWVVRGTWDWIKALGTKTITVQQATVATTSYSTSVAFTTSTLEASTVAMNASTAAAGANSAAVTTMTKTNWSAVAASAALKAGLVALAVYVGAQLVFNLTGGAAAVKTLNDELARGEGLAEKARESFKKFGAGEQAALEKNIHGMEKQLEEARKLARGEGISEFAPSATVRTVADIPFFGAGMDAELKAAAQQVKELEAALAAAKAQRDLFVKTPEGEIVPAAAVQAVKDLEKSLQDQITAWGMSKREAQLHQLALGGATDSQLGAARALSQMIDELEKAKKATEDAAKAEKELTDRGADIAKSLRTPAEEFKNTMTELDNLFKAGKVSPEIYARAVDQAKKKLDQASKSAVTARASVQALDHVLSGSSESQKRLQAHIMSVGRQFNRPAGVLGGTSKADELLAQISESTRNMSERMIAIAEANF